MKNTAQWTVPMDHPVFAGHFPGAPIVPGVMLLDTALHTIAAAMGIAIEQCAISAVKFPSPARPGEALLIQHFPSSSGTIRFDIVTAGELRKIASGAVVPTGHAVNNRSVPA